MSLKNIASGVISHWPLDEHSGTRFDFVIDNDLTETNTVGFSDGKVGLQGKAANFVSANSEDLSISDALQVGLSFTNSFTFASWVRLTDKAATQIFVAKVSTIAQAEYQSFYGVGADRFGWQLFHTTGDITTQQATSFGSPTAGVFNLIICWYDSVLNTVNIQIDDGPVDSISTGGLALRNGTSPFFLGVQEDPGKLFFMNGDLDEVTFWGRVLNAAERTRLFGGGNGINLNNLL